MKDFLSARLPDAGKASVAEVSVCQESGRLQTSVMFEDHTLFTYKAQDRDGAPVMILASRSTKAQRADYREREGVLDLDCLGYQPRGQLGYTVRGIYRFDFDKAGVAHAYAKTYTVVNYAFDNEVRSTLEQAAGAVTAAIAAHQKFVPPEQTWGAKP